MWLQRPTYYLLKNRWQALALTLLISCIPFAGLLGILLAAFMTLVKGAFEGALFTIAATLGYLASFYLFNQHDSSALITWTAVSIGVLSNVLTWAFAVMLFRKTNWSALLQIAALLGVLAVSVIHLVYPDVANWWATQLEQIQQMAGALPQGATAVVPSDQREVINITKQYATGLVVAAILFNAILQLVVGRWWQTLIFAPGRLRNELQNIRLSSLAGILFMVSLGLLYWGNRVVLDMMPVLYLLVAVAGLSLVHYLFKLGHSSLTWFWLLLFYVVLIISTPVGIMLVAILALLDIWLDVRKRFKKV